VVLVQADDLAEAAFEGAVGRQGFIPRVTDSKVGGRRAERNVSTMRRIADAST
jgi:hypothetical protein